MSESCQRDLSLAIQTPELCIQCGERPPVKPRRICKPCRSENEIEGRKRRIEKQSKLPCIVKDCPEPRAVTPTQVKTRCREHQRQYQADLRRQKGTPERKQRPDAPEGMWWCSKCEQIKPIEECVKKGDKWGRCKECEKIVQAESYARNLETARKTSRDSQHRNKHRRTYGVDRTELEAQTDLQDGKCAVCKKERKLVPDHDHNHPEPKTRDAVRGLICGNCNLALGHLGDDPETILALLVYIKSPPYPFRDASGPMNNPRR